MMIGDRVSDMLDDKQGVIIAFFNETPIPALEQATIQMDGEIRSVNISRLRAVTE